VPALDREPAQSQVKLAAQLLTLAVTVEAINLEQWPDVALKGEGRAGRRILAPEQGNARQECDGQTERAGSGEGSHHDSTLGGSGKAGVGRIEFYCARCRLDPQAKRGSA